MADTRQIIIQKSSANTPPTATAAATALVLNSARSAWMIQNLGTNALFINFGGSASASNFHVVLKGGTANDDGTAGSFSQAEGVVFTGTVTVAGTLPRYTVLEIN